MFKHLYVLLASIVACLGMSCANAQTSPKFPDRPITLLVPYAPGGAGDTLGRLIGKKMGDLMGQPVIIDNRPGASGVIASQQLLHMPADGYTLMLVVNTHTINSSVMSKLPYEAKDFAPIGTFASSRFLLAVNPNVKAHNLQEFIALARQSKGGLSYGTIGSAGIGRVVGETFGAQSGTTIRYVPYRGSAPLLTDVLSGTVDYVIDTPNVYLNYIATGQVRPIAISGDKRHPALPNVPTFAEAGLKEFNPKMWFGILTRTGVPESTIDTLSAKLREALNSEEIQKALADQTFEPFFTTPSEFNQLLSEETARWAEVVRRANIKVD